MTGVSVSGTAPVLMLRCELCAEVGAVVTMPADVDALRVHAYAYHLFAAGPGAGRGVTTDRLSDWVARAMTPTRGGEVEH